MEWRQEFRYLTTPHTQPSEDDLYNSLRNVIEKEQAAALAGLFVAIFDRILHIEGRTTAERAVDRAFNVAADRQRVATLRAWLERISTSAGMSAEQLQELARWALAGFPADLVITDGMRLAQT